MVFAGFWHLVEIHYESSPPSVISVIFHTFSIIFCNICSRDDTFVSNFFSEVIEVCSVASTPEEISHLEEFIPVRLSCLTLLQVSVTVSMAEFNLLHALIPVIMGHKVETHYWPKFFEAHNILKKRNSWICAIELIFANIDFFFHVSRLHQVQSLFQCFSHSNSYPLCSSRWKE